MYLLEIRKQITKEIGLGLRGDCQGCVTLKDSVFDR